MKNFSYKKLLLLTFLILLFQNVTSQNKKISQLPIVIEANATAIIPIVQNGITSQISASNLTNEYIRKAEHSVTPITTTQTINLSTTFSVNILIVSNPGLTLTIQFPTSPLESQICEFTTLTNTVTIVAGSGNFNPVYSGAPTAGFSATYVYHESDDTWYKIGS
tara:strand:+ start:658 stop:1149 length:492 start_codon:yes stop_codon:yes gene_type:complete